MRAELKGRRLGLIAAGALACGVSAVAPAAASATTLSVDHECYRPGQTTRVSGDGYTPGSEVDLSFTIVGASGGVGGDALITQADDAGRVDMKTSGPQLPWKESPATVFLTATDSQQAAGPGDPALASTEFRLENFDAWVPLWNRGIGKPGRRARFALTGFTLETGRTVYVHYVRNGRLRKTVAVGQVKGACGDLFKSVKQFPFRPVPAGRWSMKVDTKRQYPNHAVGRRYHVRVSPANAVR
jgi:hypothetical protein